MYKYGSSLYTNSQLHNYRSKTKLFQASMASYNNCNEGITEAEITGLNIRELNKKLKQNNVSKYEQQEIKKQRRKIKMKKYRRDSRMRRATDLEKLIELKALLRDEFVGINQEVIYLRSCKELLCELMRDDDDEYGEYVVVD